MMASKGQKAPPPKFTSFRPQPASATAGNGSLSGETVKASLPKRPAPPAPGAGTTATRTYQERRKKRSEHHVDSLVPNVGISDKTFVLDRKGDRDNQRYGSMDKYRVPKYRRSGFGSVMGVPRWWKINRDSERQNGIELRSPQYDQRLLSSRHTRSSKTGAELRIKPEATSTTSLDVNDDFISISGPRSKKRKRSLHDHNPSDSQPENASSSDSSDEEVEPIISLALSGRGDPNDPDLEPAATEATDLAQAHSESLIADLNKRLRIDPSRGDLWLELVNAANETASQAGARGNAEVRMSLLTEGLKKVKDAAGRESLLLAYVTEAETAMESERLLKTWEDIIKKNGHLLSLRRRFLHFLQTTFSVFHANEFRDYALESLSACRSLKLDAHKSPADRVRQNFDLLLLTTACLRDSGLSELANAVWQANLELNFLRNKLSGDIEGLLINETVFNVFEEVWESEVPRIGDHNKGEGLGDRSSEVRTPNFQDKSSVGIGPWSKAEQQASAVAELSGRTTDEDEQDDPFRVVLFSDISSFLFATTGESDEKALVNAFLSYFQLPSFVPAEYLADDRIRATWLTSSGHTTFYDPNKAAPRPNGLCPITNSFQLDDVSLFGNTTSWFSPFAHTSQHANRHSFCRRALQRLTELGVGSVALAEYVLGWELFAEPLNARKLAKKALKRYPASIRLYNSYAHIEAKCGKEGAAEDVLRTVLESNKDHHDSILLKRTWLWLLIEAGSHEKALSTLLDFNIVSDTEPKTEQASTVAVLKVRKAVSFEVDRLLSVGDHEHASRYMELGVLLEYLSSPTPLTSALDSFGGFRARFPPSLHRTRSDELFNQFRARLLYTHHSSGREFALLKPREILLESIKAFPNNAIFFSLLEVLDPWVGVNDRLHTILTSIRNPLASQASAQNSANNFITPHLYAVRSEVRRYNEGKSTVHAVRHAFERGVNSAAGAHCPLLWRWYSLFECNAGDLRQARQTLYRAIRACPWIKDIYMMAFDEMRSAMSVEDLRGVYELMEDKELRIRIPLDAYVK